MILKEVSTNPPMQPVRRAIQTAASAPSSLRRFP
jgi:hypothetical protein